MTTTRNSRGADALLWLLIATDLAFCGIDLLHKYSPWASDWHFSIELDRSYAELFQYIKYLWLVLLLALLAFSRRAFLYLGWMLVFASLLTDDVFEVHEHVGTSLSVSLGLPGVFGLRPSDLGELLVAGMVGGSVVALIGLGYLRAAPVQRLLTRHLALLLVALGLFGVLIDTLHISVFLATPERSDWLVALALLEDGGEMITVSFMVWVLFRHWLNAIDVLSSKSPTATLADSTSFQHASSAGPHRRA